ncbi:MAG: PTS mannitol transporter subunit IICBA [Bacillota bacterium]
MGTKLQKFGRHLSSMVMPNIGAFIAWGLITALFIPAGWFPNEQLSGLVDPMVYNLLPILIGYTGGKMIGGDRGGVMGGIATMGVIVGSPSTPMFIGAMLIGPLAGYAIKLFDKAMDGKMPAGFEMLINNFSIGIIGMIIAIFGYYAIGPAVASLTAILETGVDAVVEAGMLPAVALFVEPAKVLFLNNALNHGIFTPLGANDIAEAGKSIMYMLEANPGPGVGVLLAYCLFGKGSAKSSAPGAVIIHFFGGIQEIYFPYVLMNPVILLAPICGSVAAISFYTMMDAGLVGAAAPGSIIAFVAMAPQGETLTVVAGVLIAAVVSFLVAAPIVKFTSKGEDSDALEEAQAKSKSMKVTNKNGEIKKIVFACDAGMGSSAMGATKFRNRLKAINPNIIVTNSAVDVVPSDADVVVCQVTLQDRAKKSAPQAQLITIGNFLSDKNLDELHDFIKANQSASGTPPTPVEEAVKVEEVKVVAEVEEADETGEVITLKGIQLGLKSVTKEYAITKAGSLLHELGYTEQGYTAAMLDREKLVTTYIGEGVAIPHGTSEGKQFVKKTGIVCLQYPDGIPFDDEKAQLIFGIAGLGDEHLELLGNIAEIIEDEETFKKLVASTDPKEVLAILKNNS